MKTRNSIRGLLLIPLLFVCFGLSPTARAATPEAIPAITPTPDGCYPGFNTAEGCNALLNINTASGQGNTGLGFAALKFLTTGDNNTAVGVNSLLFVSSAMQNTAVGQGALQNNNGNFNSALGFQALAGNTTGTQNVAAGWGAYASNVNGSNGVATGFQALNNNTTGDYNTATGFQALFNNVNGATNTATGPGALFFNADGFGNTATGANFCLYSNTHGNGNTATGSYTLPNNQLGSYNSAYGWGALYNNVGGSFNTAIGVNAGANLTASNNVCIGRDVVGVPGESDTTRIRNIYASVATAREVFVNADNKLGTLSSSRRFKEEIKRMDKASEALFALSPVSFRYKKEIDPAGALSFGLIAEEVAEISPELITRDEEGKPQTVRYEAVNAMLLNEFLKEHRKVEKLETVVAQQHKEFEAALTELKGQIQKVSAQLELNKPAPQTVLNNR